MEVIEVALGFPWGILHGYISVGSRVVALGDGTWDILVVGIS